MSSLRSALEAGWKVRLCFDPILAVNDWKTHYSELIDAVSEEIPVSKLHDVSIGVFRMGKDYFKRTKKNRPDSLLVYHDYEKQDGVVSYPTSTERELTQFLQRRLAKEIAEEKIFVL